MSIRVIIAGGRDFQDYELLKEKCDWLFSQTLFCEITIICGEAIGADSLGRRYAKENDIQIESYPVTSEDWEMYGKRAGYLRNVKMAETATHLIAFWNGYSKGTEHMIDLGWKKDLDVRVFNY
jgi:hypothetical protein